MPHESLGNLDGNAVFPPKKFYWLATFSIVIGLALLLTGFFLSDPPGTYHSPFFAYLLTNLGGLLVFGAAYSLVSEGHLRQDFAQQLSHSIDTRLSRIDLDSTIAQAGLSQVIDSFSHHQLHERVEQALTVKMVVMRNNTYFRDYRESLFQRIRDSNLNLHILMPDPREQELMMMLAKRYDEYEAPALAESIGASAQNWLKQAIFDKLPEAKRDGLTLYLDQRFPFYSAYIFDANELWYIPYHARQGRQRIPVFVFRRISEDLPIYRDVLRLFETASKHDLGSELQLQWLK